VTDVQGHLKPFYEFLKGVATSQTLYNSLEEKYMPELKGAITFVEIIVGTVVAMLLGDYLGYRIGRWRLAAIVGGIALVSIVAFAIYAAIVLA
jgi:hypothetical protein